MSVDLRGRQSSKACQEGYEAGAVFLGDGGEFEPHTGGAVDVTHNGLGPDLPLVDKKVDLCLSTDRAGFTSFKKESTKADTANPEDILVSGAAPVHANVCLSVKARCFSSRLVRGL